ncbi:uncharacterized protein LOC132199387 [Neocloeon triangulifer]|uniref:uncharacterized protein LOC132199387 n=1 Tax=Neocloeon triangulifer TaxID=2078957 RepID=UPI00286F6583|nr:uncharacterized protein LOC132199387 [Neocloeon triangulifer]
MLVVGGNILQLCLFGIFMILDESLASPRMCGMDFYDIELTSCCRIPPILTLYSLKACVKNENQRIADTDPFCLFDCLFKNTNFVKNNGDLNTDVILKNFSREVPDNSWLQLVTSAVTVCSNRIQIDASLKNGEKNGCQLQPGLFALCFRKYIFANCPAQSKPKTDSNSCTQRLMLADKCDPFAMAQDESIGVLSDGTFGSEDKKPLSSSSKRPQEISTRRSTAKTTSRAPLPITEISVKPEVKTARNGGNNININSLSGIDLGNSEQEAAAEGQQDEEDARRPELADVSASLVTIQRQIRNIETLESAQAREDLADKVREGFDVIVEDVEQLGREKPEVMRVAPRLARIREELTSFSGMRLTEGLSARLLLEVDSVRKELLQVATNIQKGFSDVGESIRKNVSNVALNVAEEAAGLGTAVGAGLKNAGNAIKAGVDSAQNGIASLSMESAGQLLKIGSEVSAGVANVKSSFERMRQESFQRINGASSDLSSQLVSGLKSLHKLRDESTQGAQSLSKNIQQSIQERLNEITKQFGNLRLTP